MIKNQCAADGIQRIGHDISIIARERSELIVSEIQKLETNQLPFSVSIEVITVRTLFDSQNPNFILRGFVKSLLLAIFVTIIITYWTFVTN